MPQLEKILQVFCAEVIHLFFVVYNRLKPLIWLLMERYDMSVPNPDQKDGGGQNYKSKLTSFDSWRWNIFSSTVPVARNRYVKHLFFWPSLQQRAAACLSIAGFQSTDAEVDEVRENLNATYIVYTRILCQTSELLETYLDQRALNDCLRSDSIHNLLLYSTTEKQLMYYLHRWSPRPVQG